LAFDFVFCAPPGLASFIDFCLRFEMPSGSLPPPDFDLEAPPDLPLGPPFPLLLGFVGAIVCGGGGCGE
jgi:hypothetical protein